MYLELYNFSLSKKGHQNVEKSLKQQMAHLAFSIISTLFQSHEWHNVLSFTYNL